MTRDGYRVNLTELESLIDKAADLQRRILDHLNDIDTRVGALHDTWDGDAAAAHREHHENWMRAAHEAHAALADVRHRTARAHRVYDGVTDHNHRMWP